LTTEGWMMARASEPGVRNQHRSSFPNAGDEDAIEFEIKRNKAHGGCLGIERR
jgi:hypothetical protein